MIKYFLFFIILVSCGRNEKITTSSITSQAASKLYFQGSKRIIIKVYYEPGAEPFAGSGSDSNRYLWYVLQDNLAALFQYKTNLPELIVPKELTEMTEISLQNKSSWSIEDSLSLHSKYQLPQAEGDSVFSIFFVNGYSAEGQGVLGFNVNGVPLVMMFKSVIKSTGILLVQKYVEQSTLVHEMGHALGFVNNGVPMKTPYEDSAHKHHSLDENCVMFWKNEGASDLIKFVTKFMSSGNTVMWGSSVLEDARGISK